MEVRSTSSMKTPNSAVSPTVRNGANERRSSVSSFCDQPRGLDPLVLHFDVNKTVIQTDSIRMDTIDEGLREGIADLFWGRMKTEPDGSTPWEWTKSKPSCNLPTDIGELGEDTGSELMTYAQYCKVVVKDKQERKLKVRSFKLVSDDAREEMEKLLQLTIKKMELSEQVINNSADKEEAGLMGTTIAMFPSLFKLVATLQRQKRIFAVLFRSFGNDHHKIMKEWNAFCVMKHPVFSHLLQGIGPLDGTQPGVPDRRIHNIHTLYRDAGGPLLILDVFTNGPEDYSWDQWAKEKPKAKEDTRGGREYVKTVLRAKTVEGIDGMQGWFRAFALKQATSAIKDDWAWWTWNGEVANAGKLLTVIPGAEETKQLFFDDNIDLSDARIVDCRNAEGEPLPSESAMNRLCTKVNPIEALLDDDYFLRKIQVCHGDHLDVGASLIDFQSQLAESEEQKDLLMKQVKSFRTQLKNLTEENHRMKLLHRIRVHDEAQLRKLLLEKDVNLDEFGKNGYNNVKDLFEELEQGHCWLEMQDGKLVRIFEMVFLKIQFKDQILIESHEQDAEFRARTRNYLPGVRKSLTDTSFEQAMERWMKSVEKSVSHGHGHSGLQGCMTPESLPLFTPEAPKQATHATEAYPIPCKVQQSEAAYFIPEKALETNKELLGKIGISGGVGSTFKHFTSTEPDILDLRKSVTHFWRWERLATWEATAGNQRMMTAMGGLVGAATSGQQVDITKVCDKLFRGHPRREVYENLLLQMFETFTATTLCGGFSGSIVIRVQPFEPDGRPADPCIVKLDAGEPIREEFINSLAVFEALPDRAARIIGDAVYARSKDGSEFGAMRLELAGACWNVPELAQGSANLLSTFKDLLLYESEQIMLGSGATAGDRPFGNVNSVIAETFGPGGIVSSLRKGGRGDKRGLQRGSQPLFWGAKWYSLKGKEGKFNPYTAENGVYPPAAEMRRLYNKHFGSDLPDLKELVVGQIKPMLMKLADESKQDFCPLVALAHGDLNAANIMIDALDAVWLIDFATSVELPLFTDMCKFEMACLFEYATIPITPKVLMDFVGRSEDKWKALGVHEWLRIGKEVAQELLRELKRVPADRLGSMTKSHLDKIIHDVAEKGNRHKQRLVVRALKARLTWDETEMDCCFAYCQKCSKALLKGDYLMDALTPPQVPQPDSAGAEGAASIKFFMDLSSSVRRFMNQDITVCLREVSSRESGALQAADSSSLQIWLFVLKESFRIIGYGDISPQQKMWSIFHCHTVAKLVLDILTNKIKPHINNLQTLPSMQTLKKDLAKRTQTRSEKDVFLLERGGFSEADSHWIFSHKDIFPSSIHHDRIVRKVHALCPMFNGSPGFFAPIFQVLTQDEDGLIPFDVDANIAARNWRVVIKDEMECAATMNGVANGAGGGSEPPSQQGSPRSENSMNGVIGTYVKPGEKSSGNSLTLKSRLLFLTRGLLASKFSSMVSSHSKRGATLGKDFSLADWCQQLFVENGETVANRSRTPNSTPSAGRSFVIPDDFPKFLVLEAAVVDAQGQEKLSINLVLGFPVSCYPPGTKVCLESNSVAQGRSYLPEVVITQFNESGCYKVRNSIDPSPENERDFEPTAQNHVFMPHCNYKVGQRILFSEHVGGCGPHSWIDVDIVEVPGVSNGFQYVVQPTAQFNKPSAWNSGRTGGLEDSYSLRTPSDAYSKGMRYLNRMNSGTSWLSASNYEEEVGRMKAYYKARNSFIIDALSGIKLDVKTCAVPTLMSKAAGSSGPAFAGTYSAMSDGSSTPMRTHGAAMGQQRSGGTFGRSLTNTKLFSGQGGGHGGEIQDSRQGWNTITTMVERYEQGVPSCAPIAFLVLGSPGSGKSCLVHRLIVDNVAQQQDLVPLLLPIAELVKRGGPDTADPESDWVAVHTWFEKYLRLTYGDDSQRYKMVRQAICMHRALFLFEGLEDAGQLMPVIERLIKDIILDRHLVVITSRPGLGLAGSCLEDMGEHVSTMELLPLSHDQKRSIAHNRLGLERLGEFDQFVKQLQQSHRLSSDDNHDIDNYEEDVFGNPMMLSMLLCYLNKREEDRKEKEKDNQELETVTLTAVYRVSMDVMLKRVQSKAQADRFNKEEKIDLCKKILEKLAMRMHLNNSLDIEEYQAEQLFVNERPELINTWKSLKAAVIAGHAMFLRLGEDGFRFLVKGFQDFFVASEIATSLQAQTNKSNTLPALSPLLTEPWWAQTLEMLAEQWSHYYVRLIESHADTFNANKGESFLHLAAQVGHKPVFQLLKRFSEKNQKLIFHKNNDRQTPLHVAAEKGHVHICKLMIDHKAEVDEEDMADRMPMHVAMQNAHFQTAKFLLERLMEIEKKTNTEKKTRRLGREHPAEKLANEVMEGHLNEEEFKTKINETFVELNFFGRDEQVPKKQQLCALMGVYWITANQYDEFVRGQKPEVRLTKASWSTLQVWARETVGLTESEGILPATLVMAAIYNLGKIKDFKKVFAPSCDDHIEALANILKNAPLLIPSFAKLDDHLQTIILSTLNDFNFGQFLQAENLPASLSVIKSALSSSDRSPAESMKMLCFNLFRIFAAQCGLFGFKSMEGSLFMEQEMYKNYQLGLDVLQHLHTDSPEVVYNRFLAERAITQGISADIEDAESRALVRLVCLARPVVPEVAIGVKNALYALSSEERSSLIRFINADGIKEKGFLLFHAPQFLENARKNTSVGLQAAMKLLLKIYEMAEHEYPTNDHLVITIMLDEIHKLAGTCQDSEVFAFTRFSIERTPGKKSELHGSVRLSPWKLWNNQEEQDRLAEEGDSLVTDVLLKLLREGAFLKRLPQVFPELEYFRPNAAHNVDVRAICNQTRAALLVVYWVASDQADNFTRGHATEDKLSDKSWACVLELMETALLKHDVLNAVFVAMMISNLWRIPNFCEQLAPSAQGFKQVIRYVMDTCPKVLPSFARLQPEYQELVRECLTLDFDFEQFLLAENIPANLASVKETLQKWQENDDSYTADSAVGPQEFLGVLLICVFAQLSGCRGDDSLEGSLYMTESRFKRFHVGAQALQLLEQGQSEQEAYDRLLCLRAEALEMDGTDIEGPVIDTAFGGLPPLGGEEVDARAQRRALVRLACLSNVADGDAAGVKMVTEAFESLDADQRKELARHLNADGIAVRPGILLQDCPAFLQACISNKIGLHAAVRILLKVYRQSAVEFQNTEEPMIIIQLKRLTNFASEFCGSAAFQDMQFELQRVANTEAIVNPKVWIPVTKQEVLESLTEQGLELSKRILESKETEDTFREKIGRVFPELFYFGPKHSTQRNQSEGALLAVFWLMSGQHDNFIRGQPEDGQLSRQSWAWIQEWLDEVVKLRTAEALDASLVFMAIHALGKVTAFRNEFVPGVSPHKHDEALAQILGAHPDIVPSFKRLSEKYRLLIIDSLSVDFRFNQFLNAENVPANLVHMKETLKPHGDDGFAFFCFRIFAQMCGRQGAKKGKGSLFMTEAEFQRFRPGLDALQQLGSTHGDPGAAYNAFLLLRGTKAMSRFASREHQALSRLLCLGAAFDREGGQGLCDAFDKFSQEDRTALTAWLVSDGIEARPGNVLCDAPSLLKNAMGNLAVGLPAALQMLLRVQEKCAEVNKEGQAKMVVVHLGGEKGLAEWAAKAGPDPSDFLNVALDVQSEMRENSGVMTLTFKVEKASSSSKPTYRTSTSTYMNEARAAPIFSGGSSSSSSGRARRPRTLIAAALGAGGMAACLALARHLPRGLDESSTGMGAIVNALGLFADNAGGTIRRSFATTTMAAVLAASVALFAAPGSVEELDRPG